MAYAGTGYSQGPADKSVSWRVICGDEAGLAYGFSGGMSKFLNDRIPNLRLLPEPGATVLGARLVSRGEAAATYAPQGLLRDGYFNKGAFEKNPLGKVKPLHTIYFYPVTMFIVVRADSNIHKIDDLAGRRISLGVPAAGLTVGAVDLFKAWGLWDKVQNRWISLPDLADALKANTVDAVLGWSVGDFSPPTAVVQMDLYTKCRVLSISEDQKKIVNKVPGLMFRYTPAKAAFKQDIGVEKIPGFAQWFGFHWGSDADPDMVYRTVKAFFDGRGDLVKISKAFTVFAEDPKNATVGAISSAPDVPVHPGAAKFFKEIGIWQKNWIEGGAAH
jgi:TRAP transporter TAXI family solute receptor